MSMVERDLVGGSNIRDEILRIAQSFVVHDEFSEKQLISRVTMCSNYRVKLVRVSFAEFFLTGSTRWSVELAWFTAYKWISQQHSRKEHMMFSISTVALLI